jgi:hypothetical protein
VHREEGIATAQYSAMIALSLVLFVLVANAVVVMYARGVLRAALDEGVRAGSRADAGAATCLARAQDVVDDLLGGRMGGGVRMTCAQDADLMSADAVATFPAWVPGVPAYRMQLGATAVMEW